MNKLETVQLKNGLTIYFYPDSRRHSTVFQFITKFGGLTKDFVYDQKEYHIQDGVAHILEHYLVECNEEGNFLDTLGKKQMNTNASTYSDMTCFYFDAVEDVLFGIQTLLNGLTHVRFETQKLEKLKNPIYQEIRGKMNSKFYHSNLLTLQNTFHSISFRSVGGTLDEVLNTTIDDLKICYEAFYQPKNQIIVVAGNFSRDEVLHFIEDFYEKNPIPTHEVKLLSIHEPITTVKQEDTLLYPTPMDYVDITFKVDISNYSSFERLKLDYYLNRFYSDFFGLISPLYKELTDQQVITANINCGDTKIDHFLLISIGAYTLQPDQFKKCVLEVIKEGNSFDEEAFELYKKSSILHLILRDENIMSMIMPFVNNVVQFDYPYLDEVKDIENLSFSEYVKMIRAIDFSHYTIVTIKEKEC